MSWKKWSAWEYFPASVANVPIYGFYVWFALRARHFAFFSNVNPSIPLGGAAGESKWDILQMLPSAIVPKAVFVPGGTPFATVEAQLAEMGLTFPLIAKPDKGERGFLVQKMMDAAALRRHLERFPVDFIVQEFLTLPYEFSVMYYLRPSDGRFGITSICQKEFLHVVGDGRSTVRELMSRHLRASFQVARFEKEQPGLMEQVPPKDSPVLLEPIGNHARGTKFLNAAHLWDEALEKAFEPICRSIPQVHFGRFDLKCASPEALKRGEFKAMELNGVFSDPAHVFDPTHGPWRAYRDYYRQWRLLYELSEEQRQKGIPPTAFSETVRIIREHLRYKKKLNDL